MPVSRVEYLDQRGYLTVANLDEVDARRARSVARSGLKKSRESNHLESVVLQNHGISSTLGQKQHGFQQTGKKCSHQAASWSGANRQLDRKRVIRILVVANDRLVKHKAFPSIGRMAMRDTLPESNSRFPR